MILFRENKNYQPTSELVFQLGTETKDLIYLNALLQELKLLPQSIEVTSLHERIYDTYHRRPSRWVSRNEFQELQIALETATADLSSLRSDLERTKGALSQSQSLSEHYKRVSENVCARNNILEDEWRLRRESQSVVSGVRVLTFFERIRKHLEGKG